MKITTKEREENAIARDIIHEWNAGEESTEDQYPLNPDGPYFVHLERRIAEAISAVRSQLDAANAELENVKVERETMRKALEPFANALIYDEAVTLLAVDEMCIHVRSDINPITIGHLRQASRALKN